MSTGLHRRDLLKSFGAVALGSGVLQLRAAEPGAPLFFSQPDFALLDALTEMIIPADDHSPGAHAAGVAKYIDETVARSILPEQKTSWTKGLAGVNALSQELHGVAFLQAKPDQQAAVLKRMSAHEAEPTHRHNNSEAGEFWGQLKQTTAFAYYTSSIGIHQDMNYKGNVILEQFVGYDAT